MLFVYLVKLYWKSPHSIWEKIQTTSIYFVRACVCVNLKKKVTVNYYIPGSWWFEIITQFILLARFSLIDWLIELFCFVWFMAWRQRPQTKWYGTDWDFSRSTIWYFSIIIFCWWNETILVHFQLVIKILHVFIVFMEIIIVC